MGKPGLVGALIESQGCQMLGGLYLAGGDWPRPAVLLLHGLPGHEKNLDLAHALRQVGIHCLYFHYRGSWGSHGDYSMEHLVPDTLAALAWLRARPEVDSARVALVGMSLGGWTALAAAAEAPEVAAVVALAPLIDPRRLPLPLEVAADFAASLHGTSAERLQAEWERLTPLPDLAPALADRPVLLVTADQDLFFPPDHYPPLVDRLPQATWVRFPRADHLFSDIRPGLTHVVRRWLLHHLDPD